MRRSIAAVLLGAVLMPSVLAASAAAAAKQDVDRVIRDGRISESSGLAASPRHPGILWTHNDSGHANRIYAVAKDGTTAATITVKGAESRDWEAITASGSYLAIGDIGDNNYYHDYSRIYVLPEPKDLVTQSIRVQRTIRFTFPGGPRNAEALLADPATGQFYVVTKDIFSAQVYAIPRSAWPQTTTGTSPVVQATLVASTNASLITDGSFLPDGRMLIRGYGRLYLLDAPGKAKNKRLNALLSVSLPDQEQGESLTVVDDGRTALIGSEGSRQPVLKLDLADYGMASGEPAIKPTQKPASGAEASPSSGPGVTAAPEPGSPFGVARSTWVAVGAGAGALVLLVIGGVVLARRH